VRATTKNAVMRRSAECNTSSGESISSAGHGVDHAKSCLCCMPSETCVNRALRAVLSVREWRRGAGLAAWVSSSRAVCGASVARRKACKTRWEGGPS
jgi:hypothetical protein